MKILPRVLSMGEAFGGVRGVFTGLRGISSVRIESTVGDRMDRATAAQMIDVMPRLRRFVLTLTRSDSDADDLTQATVERAISRISQWDPATRLDSWLYRIAQNLHLNEMRSRSVRQRGLKAIETTTCGSVEGGAEAASDLSRMRDRIRALPPEQRQVLLLVAVEGYRYAEAAEIVGVPVGTITSRLARARTALAEMNEGPRRQAHG